MTFREKLIRFFYGRYGNDKLNYFLMFLYIALLIVNCFIRNIVLYLAPLLLLALIIFRTLSKKRSNRAAENRMFLKITKAIYSPFKRFFRRIKNIKTYRYRKCPSCKKTLRLPRKRGKHGVICPCCKTKFKVNIRF